MAQIAVRDWRDSVSAAGGEASLVLTDPPYGTTQNEWDKPIDAEEFYRLGLMATKGRPVIVTSAEPFTSKMVIAAGKHFKYCWYWDKRLSTGHLNAKKQPLRQIEPVVVAYRACPTYNPQMALDARGNRSWHRKNKATGSYNSFDEHYYESEGKKYPTTLLPFYQSPRGKTHPTEKPVELMRYFIETYTNPGDLVVDPFCGTGAVAVACHLTERRFIGGDLSHDYVSIAQRRVHEAATGDD